MARRERIDVGGYFYHVINRCNARATLFHCDEDYLFFEDILEEAVEKFDMRLITYCIMPNHWHLLLYPRESKDIQKFMQWLTVTHTQRLHARDKTIGYGHIYQGRYKSFIVETDQYLQVLMEYIEQNPLRAQLVKTLNQWYWGGNFKRNHPDPQKQQILYTKDIEYSDHKRIPVKEVIMEIRHCIEKGKPFGTMEWVHKIVKQFSIQSCLTPRGRPRKGT